MHKRDVWCLTWPSVNLELLRLAEQEQDLCNSGHSGNYLGHCTEPEKSLA